ncbi:MAG: F0F1 ATP synthase subunit B [Acidimicrobiales bacterium]
MLGATTDFLLPNATFIPEVITFFILLGVLAKYILPPINRAMEARRAQIAESVEVIEQARTTEEEARVRSEAMLAEARREARAQVEQATRLGEELREELRRRGREEYERTLARAEVEIERATQRATDELRRRVADLVVAASEQVIGRELGGDGQRALIEQAIAEVETSA